MLSINFNKVLSKALLLIFSTLLFGQVLTVHAAQPVVGQTYYTAYNFMFEKGKHNATNYWRGELMPLNTKVRVERITAKKMVLSVNGQEVTIVNAPKRTKKSIEQVADNLLSNRPVSNSGKFSKEVKFGEMRLGMTKEQVIKTRGYPPAHKTFSTESDRWIYWSSRFVQRTLIFRNNRLVEGRGLR